MSDPNPEQEFDGDPRFAHLVVMLSSTAMQQLGKLVHPATGKAEIDLEGAQMMIDLLEGLETKTKGNLSEDENRMLSESLMGLRMNFVHVVQSVQAAQGDGTAGATPEPDPAEAGEKPAAPPAPESHASKPGPKPGDDEGKKFHKSYG